MWLQACIHGAYSNLLLLTTSLRLTKSYCFDSCTYSPYVSRALSLSRLRSSIWVLYTYNAYIIRVLLSSTISSGKCCGVRQNVLCCCLWPLTRLWRPSLSKLVCHCVSLEMWMVMLNILVVLRSVCASPHSLRFHHDDGWVAEQRQRLPAGVRGHTFTLCPPDEVCHQLPAKYLHRFHYQSQFLTSATACSSRR